MSLTVGQTVRVVLDVLDDTGMVVPAWSRGVVVALTGDGRVVVSFGDATATVRVWEVKADR